MNYLHVRRLVRIFCGGSILWLVASLNALEPPTPQQLQQYKADGSLAARAAKARELGNHLADPTLISRMQAKLQREAAKAAGLPATAETQDAQFAPPSGRNPSMPSKGTVKIIVLLVDFPEYPHAATDTVEDVAAKLFGNGDPNNYPYESMHNYYSRSSQGQLDIQGNVLGWYRAAHDRGWYEGHDTGFPAYIGDGEETLVEETLNYFNGQGHDFSQYDNNGDGSIDSLYIKWTGPDNGWSNFWWAKSKTWPHGYLVWPVTKPHDGYTVDGKSINRYVWSWIWNSAYDGQTIYQPGVDIHETGHQLGLPDLYDYDGNQGPDGGVGNLDMMDANYGDHNCFSKFMLDWLTPTYVTSGSQILTLNPSGNSPDCVLIMPGYTGGIFGEFYMAQYRRQNVGNDPWYYPNSGYTIWHIDSRLDGDNFAYDNSYTGHKLVRLMEADGLEHIENNQGADAGDFYGPGAALGDFTAPNSRNYDGGATNILIDQFTAPGTSMSARFSITTTPILQSAGASLTTESFLPANQTIDPGETVTVNLSLQNLGAAGTADLVGTLLAAGGVTSPSAAQSFGAMPQLGVATRAFSFVAGSDCGGKVVATLQLQDGATDYGTISFPLQTGLMPLSENFDTSTLADIPAGWTAAEATGQGNPWSLSYDASDTPNGAAYCPDPGHVSDNILEAPAMTITSPTAQLSFRHAYDFDTQDDNGNLTYWGGGVVEIAIGSAPFTDIIAAGGNFVTGGYTGTISGGYGNPIEGRSAWIYKTTGFTTTVINLPTTAAGQTVKLRWRFGSDNWWTTFGGWWVDSVTVRNLPTTQNFDLVAAPALPSGWVARANVGEVAPWATAASEFDTGPNCVFSPNADFISDNWLTSPSMNITSETLQLAFRHHYSLEGGYDGGLLEISINGGDFVDIVAAGGNFTTGGYTNVIPYGWGNPIAGSSAWSGESGGFITTVAALPIAAVGQSVKFRWRLGADNGIPWGGWFIDTVALVSGTGCCMPLMENAGAALVAESYSPLDQAIDPQEIVTVRLSLRNIGRNTSNLVATLLPIGGVASPSGPQNYGATTAGGVVVARDFSFTAAGDCGTLLRLTLQLQDGTTNFPPVTFTLPVGNIAMQQSFDGLAGPALPSGWIASVNTGNVIHWTTTPSAADTSLNAAFAPDPPFVADNWLTTPNIAITSSAAQLSFRQAYDFNAYYDALGQITGAWDGGVLDISIGGGAFTDIIDAGGSFVTGGYNNWIQGGYQNPVGNRWGWGGHTNGFTTTVINLPPTAAGQNIKLRWRLGSDDSEPGFGWYLDTVSIRNVLASEYFDAVAVPDLPTGWTPTVAAGSVQPWATSQPYDTGLNSVYSPDPAGVADNRLDSAPITIMSTTPQLKFRNYYNFQAGYDGGVLEISVANGPFTDIIAAGGVFVTGGYTGPIATGQGNPLAGRQSWTGNSGGFITTVVNLPVAAVGRTIKLRWRMGSDNSVESRGWFIDSMNIVGGCPMPVFSLGDFDADSDVDQEDFGLFQACLTADGQAVTDLHCEPGRMDADGDVDQSDLAVFKRCHTQTGTPPDPNCRN